MALIAAIAAVVGGAVGAIASPLGRDWLAHREDKRIARRQRSDDALNRLKRLQELLATIHEAGADTPNFDRAITELRVVAAAVGDPELTRCVAPLIEAGTREDYWLHWREACERVGGLLRSS